MSTKPYIFVTSAALIVIPLILLKQQCENGWHPCTFEDFPCVSNTLGIFPNDKTYIFMMNFWTFVQFCSQRAYFGKLATLSPAIPEKVNKVLYIIGMIANVAGPILVYFDHTVKHPTPEEKTWT